MEPSLMEERVKLLTDMQLDTLTLVQAMHGRERALMLMVWSLMHTHPSVETAWAFLDRLRDTHADQLAEHQNSLDAFEELLAKTRSAIS